MIVKCAIHLILLGWAVSVFWLASQDALGADPVKAIIHFYGIGALNLLVLTLVISPAARKFKLSVLMRQRRLIGLYCFAYACMHIICYWWLELNFSPASFVDELVKRPYIWLGMLGFVILLTLAATSPHKAKLRLGRRWQTVHNFIYLASILVWLHFFLSRKADILEPGLYALTILLLLSFRYRKLQRWYKNRPK
ncbi:sulfite oxidase subunit YedZ [Catenovulum agarivorans DS-2]|uniref:Protein-methionine-sulfoxide reductase heme-binding subunit MsrQ n=1 Tax=Catenovulum agarivorans DS-2 TaxID=1328313 RepID=W7QT42_9ALTE|nr:protein-methionine-sulfoxide reductase heme-binding subunit MsrQ [Catenovulum agarivorans]EWH12192.1 sulfite oxidase subunit YedZ [Catenovulum agarivorans DS-2]